MLIVAGKPVDHTGEGLFDFGKLLFKKVLKSGFARKAHKAINSNLGKAAISTIKKAVNSEIGQELQKQALSAVQDVSEKALNKIQLPESVKNAARSELGQQLQNKIISEVGNTVQQIAPGSRKRARNITKTAFEKLGVAQPKKRRRKKKGKGIVYPSKLLNQFSGQGIILE